jgi:hypothetical protein
MPFTCEKGDTYEKPLILNMTALPDREIQAWPIASGCPQVLMTSAMS